MHILEYLSFKSSPEGQGSEIFDLMHKSSQLIQIMGSVFRQNNLDSSCNSLVLKIKYGEYNQISGFDFDSYIIDFTLPFSEYGRSFSILHSIVSCANYDIKKLLDLTESEINLNFFQKYVKRFNSRTKDAFKLRDLELWTRFHDLLLYFKFERYEIIDILRLLTFILHCNDTPISKKKTSFNKEEFFLGKSANLKKIIKNLGMSNETDFLDNFGVYESLEDIKAALIKLMKFTYFTVFEFIKAKIKIHISNFFDNKYSLNKIKKSHKNKTKTLFLVDNPGQIDDQTLGGMLINLVNECQYVSASSTYLSVVEKLEDDQLNVNNFKKLHCTEVVDAFLGNQGLLKFLSKIYPEYFFDYPRNDKTKKIFKFSEYEVGNEIKSRDYAFSVKFSHKQVVYNYQSLHNEIQSLTLNKKLNQIYNLSKNSVISYVYQQMPGLFEEKNSFFKIFQENLKHIFKGHDGMNPYIIYSLHSKNSLKSFYKDYVRDKQFLNNYGENSSWYVPIKNTVNICKNSLIIPVLFWEWFGYHEWMEVGKFISEFADEFVKVKGLLKSNKSKRGGDINFKNMLSHEIISYMLTILIGKRQYILGNSQITLM